MKIIYSFARGFWYWENEYEQTCSARSFWSFGAARRHALEYAASMHVAR